MLIHAVGRMFLALAFVLGLLWLFAKYGRGRQQGKIGSGAAQNEAGRIEMVSRRSMGRHSSIAVVRVGDRTVVLGQTPQQITVLLDLDAPVHQASIPAVAQQEFAALNTGVSEFDEFELAGEPSEEDLEPWLAREPGAEAPKAWDAFIDGIREITVRH